LPEARKDRTRLIALIQRVANAAVHVAGQEIAAIGPGILALVGVERGDGDAEAARLAERVAGYRVFADGQGKMNLALKDVAGALLAVPQFTLAADTNSGMRPSFSSAAAPAEGERLFLKFAECVIAQGIPVRAGRFGADMKVSLVNDGPVTFWLQVRGPKTS
jgi:D-aminoacyl-tRNA deacylase